MQGFVRPVLFNLDAQGSQLVDGGPKYLRLSTSQILTLFKSQENIYYGFSDQRFINRNNFLVKYLRPQPLSQGVEFVDDHHERTPL